MKVNIFTEPKNETEIHLEVAYFGGVSPGILIYSTPTEIIDYNKKSWRIDLITKIKEIAEESLKLADKNEINVLMI